MHGRRSTPTLVPLVPLDPRTLGRLLRLVLVAAVSMATFAVLAPPAAAVACDPVNETSETRFFDPDTNYHIESESNLMSCSAGDGTSVKYCSDSVYTEQGVFIEKQTISVTEDYQGFFLKASSPRNGTIRGASLNYGKLKPWKQDDASNWTVDGKRSVGHFGYTGIGYVQQHRIAGSGAKYRWSVYWPDPNDAGQRVTIVYSTQSAARLGQKDNVIDRINRASDSYRNWITYMGQTTGGALGVLLSGMIYGAAYYNVGDLASHDTWTETAKNSFWTVLGTCAGMLISGSTNAKNAAVSEISQTMAAMVAAERLGATP